MAPSATVVSFTWPLVLMVLLDQGAYGVPVLKRIPLWARVVALATAISRAILANRRRAALRARLDGKRVLITGGASGIGLQLARRCARLGADVIIWDIQPEACVRALEDVRELAASSSTVVARTVDVTDRERVYAEVERMRLDVGELDVVVLNAGVVSGKHVARADDDAMLRTMDVNALSHFWLVRATLPAMLERNAGQIVTIASASALGGGPGLADYAASKAAAFIFAESVRMEVRKAGKTGVTVTTVCPFFVSTVSASASHTHTARDATPSLPASHRGAPCGEARLTAGRAARRAARRSAPRAAGHV